MQVLSYRRDISTTPLGQRRGVSDLARFTLDLTWARAEPEIAVPSRDYPSPPMSGSPPLPPKPDPEAGDRSQRGYHQPTSQDAYRPGSAVTAEVRGQPAPLPAGPPTQPGPSGLPGPPGPPPTSGVVPSPLRAYGTDPERLSYSSYRRPDELSPRLMSTAYPPPMLPQHQYRSGTQVPGAPSAPPPSAGAPIHSHPPPPPQPSYPVPTRLPTAAAPSTENPAFTSPKTQRKTKGHVASACVPCKRAHLRCDSQRPCGRCLNNGKESECVDVQHKKRGRPRLRDDKDASRFDPRLPSQPEAMRRPLPLYSAGSMGTSYEDPLRRTQSYRVLKSQPTESIQPRFLERASTSDANIYPPPLSIAPRTQEPVAYLKMDLEIEKASTTFSEAIGIQTVRGRRLFDIISGTDHDKVARRHREIQDDQRLREPQYLPPIYGKEEEEKVIRALTFSPEQIARFQIERQDNLTFQATDGQQRTYLVRMGLAKQESIYFIVLVLLTTPQPSQSSFPYPSPGPHTRDAPYAYQSMSQHAFTAQPTPVSASFDTARGRYGGPDSGGYGAGPSPSPRQPGPVQQSQMMSGLSPGIQPYGPPASRSEYQAQAGPSSFQIPRSELATPTTGPPPPRPEYQLPPIRTQAQRSPAVPTPVSPWPRDERSNRVDIGGLIEKPDPSLR